VTVIGRADRPFDWPALKTPPRSGCQLTESILEPVSLYFHIPFCVHRCAYCDFNTYAGQLDSIPAYVQALCKEIKAVGVSVASKGKAQTIFFGGGTPSLLTANHYESILQTTEQFFDISTGAEISLEANPGTCSFDYLKNLRSLGFTRISFGVQSANPFELHLLERIHSYRDVVEAVKWSRQAGFDNINLDLIYGLPEQSLSRWENTLKLVLGLHPEHLSLYALTLEHGTPFGRWASRGLLPIPDPDLAAEMYELAGETLSEAGYEQYEISNWSQSSRQCRHNLQYWRNLSYLGLGAGAHGYAGGYRYSNVLRIKTYIQRLDEYQYQGMPYPLSPAMVNQHRNTLRDDMQETMLTGLRLTQEGVSEEKFRERFQVGLTEVYGRDIEELLGLGLLEWQNETKIRYKNPGRSIRLSKRGRLLGNQVFMRFVGD
jgi:oxygen-independent coproporphyrinogen-3 oxidase